MAPAWDPPTRGRTPASVVALLGRSRRGSPHFELTTNFCISRELQQHGSRERGRRCGRVPHVCPRRIMTMIRMHTCTERRPKGAQPVARRNLRNEKVRGSSPLSYP
jgi:hypothetical protein